MLKSPRLKGSRGSDRVGTGNFSARDPNSTNLRVPAAHRGSRQPAQQPRDPAPPYKGLGRSSRRVSANAFSNPSRARGGAGKGLTRRKGGRVAGKIGVPGDSQPECLHPHFGPPPESGRNPRVVRPLGISKLLFSPGPERAPSCPNPLSLRIVGLSAPPPRLATP